MCVYFRIGFIDFILNKKRLAGFINSFSPNSFKTNDEIILEYSQYFHYV